MGADRGRVAGSAAARLPHIPIRTCIGCRRRHAKGSMLRMVVRDGVVEMSAAAPGRGAYLCPDPQCLQTALQKQATPLVRAFRFRIGQVVVDQQALETEVTTRAQDMPGVRE